MTLHVLLVDDDELNLTLVSRILTMEGYKISKARSGGEAVQLVIQAKPDLAILDVLMPDTNGFELCRRLRQPPIDAKMPIILLTAGDDKDDREIAQNVGADDIWAKPFEIDQFRTRIDALLKARRTI
ncbi:MAG: response regulator [Chloroflexota bacterium]